MEKRLSKFIIIILLSIVSCKQRLMSDEVKLQKGKREELVNLSVSMPKVENDILDLDSLQIRGHKLQFTKDEVIAFWKNPDSLETHLAGCNSIESDSLTTYFYKGMTLIGYDDNIWIDEVKFSLSNEKITHPRIILSKETTLEEIKEKYENSYINRNEVKSSNETFVTIRFKTHEDWEDVIILSFENSRLVQFIILSPC